MYKTNTLKLRKSEETLQASLQEGVHRGGRKGVNEGGWDKEQDRNRRTLPGKSGFFPLGGKFLK